MPSLSLFRVRVHGQLNERALTLSDSAVCAAQSSQLELTNVADNASACGVEERECGKCEKHYKEYLTARVNENQVEVLPLMENNQLLMVLKRAGEEVPSDEGVSDEDYRQMLEQCILEKVPLEDLSAYKIY